MKASKSKSLSKTKRIKAEDIQELPSAISVFQRAHQELCDAGLQDHLATKLLVERKITVDVDGKEDGKEMIKRLKAAGLTATYHEREFSWTSRTYLEVRL